MNEHSRKRVNIPSSFLVLTGLHGRAGRDVQVVDTYERVGANQIDTELSRQTGCASFANRIPDASSMRALGIWSSYEGRMVDA